ncbi:MAG: hypothetical protein R3C71_10570 [Candidatus Krumholzibacteriia bacterium]
MRTNSIRSAGMALALLLAASSALAALPAGKVLVVEATAIEGLAAVEGPIDSTFVSSFSLTDGSLSIDKKALGTLDGVETLFLVEHRLDQPAKNGLLRRFTQDVRALGAAGGALDLLPALELEYRLATLDDGSVGLLGDGGRLFAEEGTNDPYLVWRIDGLRLMDRDLITLR